jgi:hypothetical protein
MPRIYELPTHLQVEDVLIAGLTARQLIRLMIGSSLSYGVWDQADWLPHEVRLGVAVVIAVAGLLFALLQPGGRPLDQWLLALVLFSVPPRRLTWRPGGKLLHQGTLVQSEWADLALQPAWLSPENASESQQESRPPALRPPWWRSRS